MPATPGYNEASKRASEAAKVEQQKQAAEEAKKREILNRSRTPGYVSSLDQNPDQAINQNRFTARERSEISGASAKVQAKADAKEFAKQEFAKAKAEAGPGKSVSQSLKIDIETGRVRGRTTTRDIRSGVPTRQYSTTYENPYYNQEFGTRRIGDWMRKEQAKKDRELSAAKTIPEFGNILKRQTTKKTIDNESAKQFMKHYADMQLGNIKRSRELKGQGDFSIATPKKGGGFEQVGPSGEVFQFDFVKPKKGPTHYFVNIEDRLSGGPFAYFREPGRKETQIYTASTPFLEVPTSKSPIEGFGNYFKNIAEFASSGGGLLREAKYAPEVEASAFGAIFNFGKRAVSGQSLGITGLMAAKEFGDIGMATKKNPTYFAGNIAASAATIFLPVGKAFGVSRAALGLAKGVRLGVNLKDVEKVLGKPLSSVFFYKQPPSVIGITGRLTNPAKTSQFYRGLAVPKIGSLKSTLDVKPDEYAKFLIQRKGAESPAVNLFVPASTIGIASREPFIAPTFDDDSKAIARTFKDIAPKNEFNPFTVPKPSTGRARSQSTVLEQIPAPLKAEMRGSSLDAAVKQSIMVSSLKKASGIKQETVLPIVEQQIPRVSRKESFGLPRGVSLGFRGATGAERRKRNTLSEFEQAILAYPGKRKQNPVSGLSTDSILKSMNIGGRSTDNLTARLLKSVAGSKSSLMERQIVNSLSGLRLNELQGLKLQQTSLTRTMQQTKLMPKSMLRQLDLTTPGGKTDIPTFRPPRLRLDIPGINERKRRKGRKGKGSTKAEFRSFVAGDLVAGFLGSESKITKEFAKLAKFY